MEINFKNQEPTKLIEEKMNPSFLRLIVCVEMSQQAWDTYYDGPFEL